MPVAFDRRDVGLAVTVGVAAAAISATGSGNASLWGDEAASILSAQRPLASLAALVQRIDAVHALYYLGLHVWISWFGASPFSVRLPSAIAVGVAAAGMVVLGRQLRGRRFGVIAGLLLAVLPRITDVGSEARSYAASAAIATWLTVALVQLVRTETLRRRLWVVYGILLAVGTILFLWLALVALAHLVVILFARTGPRRVTGLLGGWLVAGGLAMVAASPILTFAVIERDQIAYLATRQKYDATAIFVTPWFESSPVAIVAWLLVLAGAIISLRTAIGRRPVVRAELLLPLAWMLVPTVLLLGGSTVIAVYTPRYLAMCAPAVALLIAIPVETIAASGRRIEAAMSIAILIALIAPVWVAQRGPYAKNDSDWAEISAELGAHARPGDAVAFDDSVRPSRRPRLALHTYPAGFVGLRDPTLETPYAENSTWYDATYSLGQAAALGRLNTVKRIWLVEYAISGRADTDGIVALQHAGFVERAVIRDSRSSILEFVRS